MLGAGCGDGFIRTWDTATWEMTHQIGGVGAYAAVVAFSPDNSLVARAGWERTILIYRVSDGELLQTLTGHTDKIWSISFSPDGTLLASGSFDETVRLWQVSDGTLLQTLPAAADWTWAGPNTIAELAGEDDADVYTVAFSPDSWWLAAGLGDGSIVWWGLPRWDAPLTP
jgi:WD40 repeat protein